MEAFGQTVAQVMPLEFTTESNRTDDLSITKYWLVFSSCVFPLSTGQPGFHFSRETKQHSEKTGETQLSPNHALFLIVFCFYPLHAELNGDFETYFIKCKIEFLAINVCVLH